MTDALEEAGQKALGLALVQWGHDIYDPKMSDTSANAIECKKVIDQMIRFGLGWTWEPPYAGDGDFEWCGAFAAKCWPGIKPALRRTYFASTYRLDRYGSYRSVNGEKNEGEGRLMATLDEHSTQPFFVPRAGDILLIGPTGSGYGKHICLVESYSQATRMFSTIEGNGTGLGPNGERQQGVVRAKRSLGGANVWHARRLIRPSVDDLD